jgi:hypothetical protein
MAIGKEAVMPNALEAVRQDVEEEAADEFGDLQSYDLALLRASLRASFPIDFRSESDVRLVEIDQAIITDCNAMAVSSEIAQYLPGTTPSLFGIDYPLG